jgi:hydroxymethylglutaryl-CoA reductase
MDFAKQLRVLQAAQGDPAKLALATVDLAFPALSDAGRAELKATLEAAAIPHWCDVGVLAALLQIPPEEGTLRLAQLRKLTVVEAFPARGESALNVHEATRLALRKWLAADRPDWFRALSQRAASHFAADETPAGRIEWMYHRLCSASEEAATELENLDRDWSGSARPEDRQALSVALQDLADTGLMHGRARAWVALCIAWGRVDRGEAAQLGDEAHKILELAREADDARAEADCHCLLGEVFETQGRLTVAQAAFGQDLAISRRLAEQDPSNAGWQRDLAVAHSRVGGVLEAQGKLTEAEAVFGESLAICCRLAEQDPSNAGWQRDLAVAHSRMGGVLEAQGKLTEAEEAFGQDLAISRRLAEQDPSNAGWQRDLAMAHRRVGDVLQAQGNLTEAEAAFGESLAICRRLAEQDPSNAGWQRDLAAAHSRLGAALQAQGKSAPEWLVPETATNTKGITTSTAKSLTLAVSEGSHHRLAERRTGSRIPAFYQLTVEERQRRIIEALGLTSEEVETLVAADALPLDAADIMVENAVATFALPFGVGLNFQINGQDYIVPMVVEEPSVIAAASNAALVARAGGGFVAEADEGAMIGQIQLVRVPDPAGAAERLMAARSQLLTVAARLTPGLCRRGAGPRDVEVRLVDTPQGETMVVLHVMLNTGDAMGATATNSLVEALAPMVEELAGGTVILRTLSYLADRQLARAAVRIPVEALGRDAMPGELVAERMLYVDKLASADPYRAASHNKGIMNGIDAVGVATGQDWRGIEAGAHAYACRDGAYRSLTTWTIEDGHLVGTIELPMAVSTVGPVTEAHPRVRLALRMLGASSARELAGIMAAVGLASNLAAMRALATDGIQKDYMALHARAVSHAAGARGEDVERLREQLIADDDVKLARARELLRTLETRS